MTSFIALIRKSPDSDFGVDFPDFPGCISAGRTLDEARSSASEALDLHIEGMVEDGEALPEPSSLDQVMSSAENADAVAFLVEATQQRRSLRIQVTLPEELIQQIDRRTRNRSGFLADAARAKLRAG